MLLPIEEIGDIFGHIEAAPTFAYWFQWLTRKQLYFAVCPAF